MNALIKRYQLGSLLVLTLLLAVVLPLALDVFRLNLVGKYLTYAFVAIGLVMVWGYGGVLSLGQGVFFGLGGYAMAMFLKLEASDPISTCPPSRCSPGSAGSPGTSTWPAGTRSRLTRRRRGPARWRSGTMVRDGGRHRASAS